jgi:hypothetical protein
VLETAGVVRDLDRARSLPRALLDAWAAHLRDGLGEAGGDLLPGSVFQVQLGSRPRNPRVAYHVVVGTKSLLEPPELERAARAAAAVLRGHGAGELLAPALDAWLLRLDELLDGSGDGAVSVASASLEGAETLLVPFDHLGLVRLRGAFGDRVEAEDHPVFRSIAAWVEPTVVRPR